MKAWEGVDTAIIIKSFKKCCISNALDGTEDNILFEDDSDSDNESDTDPFADIDDDMAHDDI